MSDLSEAAGTVDARWGAEAAAEVTWLAEGEIPKAAATLLAGEPGSGKSFVACTLAAAVSQVPDARVMIAHSEPAGRLHARLVRAGADASRIELLGAGRQAGGAGKGFAGRLDGLIAWLTGAASVSRAGLIVVDDLESFLGKTLSAAELAEATARLDDLARTSGAAVVAVVRSATTTEGRVTARSLDRLMRAAEVVWMVASDREETGRRWLVPLKNNLAGLPRGKTFQMVEGRVQWLNQAVPDDALAPGSRRSMERADRQTAGVWLVEALRDADVPSRLLYAQARQCGFSRNTILRAAHRMGLHSHKSAFHGGWMYSLRDVSREVVDAYRTHPKWFTEARREKEGFGIPDSVLAEEAGDQESEAREGFGIQDSDSSSSEHVGQAFQPDDAPTKDAENAENCPKSPNGTTTPSTDLENAENCSKSPKAPISHHQSPATSQQPLATGHPSRPGLRALPPGVPPEPELRDHLGRQTAKSVDAWERWYHQWHPVIRAFNANYPFST